MTPNNRVEHAHGVRSTRNDEAPLLAAHAGRYVSLSHTERFGTMKSTSLTCLIVTMFMLPRAFGAEVHASDKGDLKVSQPLRELLREEMREVAVGIQGIAPAIATANWELVESTSSKIRASYIMEKKLTASQSAELDRALPDEFKRMDAEFHSRAERLGAAAASKDAELAVHHYSRMLESCTACHSRFASSRFPGFASSQDAHHH